MNPGMKSGQMIEALESRLLLSAARVVNVVADNRGLINIFFDQQLNGTTVNNTSVKVFLAGTDGRLNTADDVEAPATVSYGAGQQRIVINANLPADTAYWVAVKAKIVHDINGNMIDGEFNGTLPSGDGTPGGNFRFDATVAPTNQKIARFNIQGQGVNVKLYNINHLAATIPNFLHYANTGSYDGTFIHRNATVASSGVNIIQGGAFKVQNDPVLSQNVIPTNQEIAEEGFFNNDAFTIAFGHRGVAHSTSNQWFFNTTANPSLNGNFSVFGAVTNDTGKAEITHVFNAPSVLDLTSTIDFQGHSRYGAIGVVAALDSVPTFNTNVTAANADPSRDFIIVSRVAIRNAISAVPPGSFAAVAASPAAASSHVAAANVFASGIPITAATTPTWDSSLELSDKSERQIP